MLRFACDYQEGCIPEILERLNDVNLEASPGLFCPKGQQLRRFLAYALSSSHSGQSPLFVP